MQGNVNSNSVPTSREQVRNANYLQERTSATPGANNETMRKPDSDTLELQGDIVE